VKTITCTVCPNGCTLSINEETLEVTGNKCPRGMMFAKQELTCPKRTICTSVRTTVPNYPVISVRTSCEVEKKLMMDIVKELKNIVIDKPLKIGSVIVKNILNSGADIITTKEMK